ncbi:MAG: type II toxin-antitoxin system RelE/ParE family toxin [Undibacterium sp.]|nr:type II toxin-antitoxin system RelE/ParE family toxin [Opitutaceae bacterium]
MRRVDAAFASIADHPELFPPIHRGLRRVLVRRFPYAGFYRIDAQTVRVIAVLHTAMNLNRLEDRS